MIILLTTPGIKLMGDGQIGQETKSRYELVEEVFEEGFEVRSKLRKSRRNLDQRGTRGTLSVNPVFPYSWMIFGLVTLFP